MRQCRAEARPSGPTYPYVQLGRLAGPRAEKPPQAGATPDEAPIVFQSIDPGADDGVRRIELGADHLVLRRRMAGMPMKLRLAYADYEGLAVALLDPEGDGEGVAIVLVHADPALSVTLYSAPHVDDVVAEWRFWSAELGVPMLLTERDGNRRPAYPMIGRLSVGATLARRRRRGPLKQRRPSMFRRRAAGRPLAGLEVHRGERELIARD